MFLSAQVVRDPVSNVTLGVVFGTSTTNTLTNLLASIRPQQAGLLYVVEAATGKLISSSDMNGLYDPTLISEGLNNLLSCCGADVTKRSAFCDVSHCLRFLLRVEVKGRRWSLEVRTAERMKEPRTEVLTGRQTQSAKVAESLAEKPDF